MCINQFLILGDHTMDHLHSSVLTAKPFSGTLKVLVKKHAPLLDHLFTTSAVKEAELLFLHSFLGLNP